MAGAPLGEGVEDDIDEDLQLAEHDPGVRKGEARRATALPAMTMIEFSPASSTVISARPVMCRSRAAQVSSFAVENSGEPVPGGVIAEGRDEGRCSAAPCRNGLVEPLAGYSWYPLPGASRRAGMARRRDDEVEVAAPDDAHVEQPAGRHSPSGRGDRRTTIDRWSRVRVASALTAESRG